MTETFEITLNNPLTEEQWDMITDVDFDHTDRIWFHTKHCKEVEFAKVIRCINCKKFNPNAGDNEATGHCNMLGSNRVPKDGYCAWAKKREDGDEPPKVRIGAFPQ